MEAEVQIKRCRRSSGNWPKEHYDKSAHRQELAESPGETVGAFSSVDVEHG